MSGDLNQTQNLLSIIWWNTGLAPRCVTRATPQQHQVAIEVIEELIVNMKVDVIALGEVSPDERNIFNPSVTAQGYTLVDGFTTAGKSRFDMLFIYNTARLRADGPWSVITMQGNETLRVAQRLDIDIFDAKRPIHLFVSHWRSRRDMPKGDPKRYLLASRLRDLFLELSSDEKLPNVIFFGDYNDEPFDDNLTDTLLATRDRKLATVKTHLLYNPFWRHLGDACGSSEEEGWPLGGTHFYQGGSVTKWRLFDQMIFSNAFLGDGEWTLDEELTQVLDIPRYSPLLENGKECFDHAPILGVVRRD